MSWGNDLPAKAELLESQNFINQLGVVILYLERKTPEELKVLIEEQKRLGEELASITKKPSISTSEIITALKAYCDSRLKNIQYMLGIYRKR